MVEVKHPNGYTGILYGESSLSVRDKDDKEVFHTGFRNENIQTEQDLYEFLSDYPAFCKLLADLYDKEGNK